MPVKVLYATHTASPTGSTVSMHQLISGIDRSRYAPVVAFSKPGAMVGVLEAEGIRVFVLDGRGPLGMGLVMQARGLIRSEGIGLVHLNCAVPFAKYVGIAARLTGTPVVWHIREDPTGKRVRSLRKWVRLLADRIVVISTELEEYFSGTGKAVKIYNGVDTDIFRPDVDGSSFRAKAGFAGGGFVFGCIGTIEPRKGTMTFMEAARSLVDSGLDARFMLVGSGMPEYEEELAGFLKSHPELARRTYLAGSITNVEQAMAAMDAVVMPSLAEPFGRVVIEAMAAGRPVIASSVGEVPNILEGGRLGVLAEPGDSAGLAEKMMQCMDAGTGMREMVEAARASVVERFSIKKHVADICKVYEEVTGMA